MAPYVGAAAVQGVQESDCVDLCHALADLVRREPLDGCRLAGRALGATGWLAAEDQGHDAAGRVLVDAGQLVDLDVDARLLQDLAGDAGLRGLVEFEYSAGEFPGAVVGTANRQEAAVFADHHPGYGYRVQRRGRCSL